MQAPVSDSLLDKLVRLSQRLLTLRLPEENWLAESRLTQATSSLSMVPGRQDPPNSEDSGQIPHTQGQILRQAWRSPESARPLGLACERPWALDWQGQDPV